MLQLFRQYSANPLGFVEVLQESVKCKDMTLKILKKTMEDNSSFVKGCPAFAAEFNAVGLRNVRKHWEPINRKAVEIRPKCDDMLMQVQKVEMNLNFIRCFDKKKLWDKF